MDFQRFTELVERFFKRAGTSLHKKNDHYHNLNAPSYILIDSSRNTYYIMEIGLNPSYPAIDKELQENINKKAANSGDNPYIINILAMLGKSLLINKDTIIDDQEITNDLVQKSSVVVSDDIAQPLDDYLKKNNYEFQKVPLKGVFAIFFFDSDTGEKLINHYESLLTKEKTKEQGLSPETSTKTADEDSTLEQILNQTIDTKHLPNKDPNPVADETEKPYSTGIPINDQEYIEKLLKETVIYPDPDKSEFISTPPAYTSVTNKLFRPTGTKDIIHDYEEIPVEIKSEDDKNSSKNTSDKSVQNLENKEQIKNNKKDTKGKNQIFNKKTETDKVYNSDSDLEEETLIKIALEQASVESHEREDKEYQTGILKQINYDIIKEVWKCISLLPVYIINKLAKNRLPASVVYWIGAMCTLFGIYYLPFSLIFKPLYKGVSNGNLQSLNYIADLKSVWDIAYLVPTSFGGFLENVFHVSILLFSFLNSILVFLNSAYFLKYTLFTAFLIAAVPLWRQMGNRLINFLIAFYFTYTFCAWVANLAVASIVLKAAPASSITKAALEGGAYVATITNPVIIGIMAVSIITPIAAAIFAAVSTGK